MSDERYKLEYLNDEAYYVDLEQIYTDEEEPNFKINNYKTMSNEQVVEALNHYHKQNKYLGKTKSEIMKLIIEYDTNKYDTEEVVTLIKKILRMEMV